MTYDYEAFTPAEAEAVAADMNDAQHWGAAPLPCWCRLPHPPGAVGTVSPPWESELPGAGHPSAPGAIVPARTASGAARALNPPGGGSPRIPLPPSGAVLPVPLPPPRGTGAYGDAALEAELRARPAPGTGSEHRNPGNAPAETLLPAGDAALPLPGPPSSRGSAAQAPSSGANRLGVPGDGISSAGAARSSAAAPAGSGALAKWKQALADNAKEQRRQRGRHRAQPGYRTGMNRRAPE